MKKYAEHISHLECNIKINTFLIIHIPNVIIISKHME